MNKRIFVVDDERIIADSLATILNNSGYVASSVYDAESALLACELGNPDCLITDVVMPGMSGIDLAVEIKDRFPACRVLLFSGRAATSDLLTTVRGRGSRFRCVAKARAPKGPVGEIGVLDTRIADEIAAETAHQCPADGSSGVSQLVLNGYGTSSRRTVTISGNHSPLPMIVSVTHQPLEPGVVGLIMFQEVL